MPGPGPVKAREPEVAATVDAPDPPPDPPLPDLVPGALVVVVTAGGAVVAVEPPPARAITGAMEGTDGVAVVMPEGVTELLG